MKQRTVCSDGHVLEGRESGEMCGKPMRHSGMSFYTCMSILGSYDEPSGAGAATISPPPTGPERAAPDPDPASPIGGLQKLIHTFIPREIADPLLKRTMALIGKLVSSGMLGEEEGKEANDIVAEINRIVLPESEARH